MSGKDQRLLDSHLSSTTVDTTGILPLSTNYTINLYIFHVYHQQQWIQQVFCNQKIFRKAFSKFLLFRDKRDRDWNGTVMQVNHCLDDNYYGNAHDDREPQTTVLGELTGKMENVE